MALVLVLIVLALLFGAGAVIEGLFWAVLIAIALFVAAAFFGVRSYRSYGGGPRSV